MNREEKLAAAKKKLKKFKQKRGREPKSKEKEGLKISNDHKEENQFNTNNSNKKLDETGNNANNIVEGLPKDNGFEPNATHTNESSDKEAEPCSVYSQSDTLSNLTVHNGVQHSTDEELITETTNEKQQFKKMENESLVMDNSKKGSPLQNYESGTTTETILQISTKLNGIAAEVNNVMQNDGEKSETTSTEYVLSELETRNQQLAEQLASVNRQKQELFLQVEKLTQQMTELQLRMETEKKHLQNQSMQEQAMLRQQIQVQMQTIGILVAEKQEMQHQVHEARTSANHDEQTRQRCQDELQDAKIKLQSLEREVSAKSDLVEVLTNSKSELELEQKNLQLEYSKTKKSKEDSSMHVIELTQKLNAKEKECGQLSLQADDLHEKLAMAEVLLQQLSSSSGEAPEDQVCKLQDERENLNQKLIEYQQAFEQLTTEREQLSRQYEDVNNQMQHQVSELSQQVEILQNEKSSLLSEKQHLDLKFQQLEEDKMNATNCQQDQSTLSEELQNRIQALKLEVEKIGEERDVLMQKLNAQLRNNERLARLNEEQELQLTELGETVDNSSVSAEEHARLLEQAQNDKSTISRALLQNKQLKQQLEEMHAGFIKLSNDKMQLASELSTISHTYNESKEDTEKYKALLSEMKLELESKNRNINQIQNALMEQENPEQQIANQSPNVTINEEVKTLEDTVNILSEQNAQLKEMVTRLQNEIDSKEVARMNVSIQELQEENAGLLRKLEAQKVNSDISEAEQLGQSSLSESVVSLEEHNSLVQNMSLLQERFTKVMTQKVEALNKVEELEHINLQLQNECDTIGEYITLYHNQRQLLKQRHHEKDEYVSSIAQEREIMQNKLEKLQTLVLTLVNSRQEKETSFHENLPPDSSASSANNTFISDISDITPHDWPDMLEGDETKQRLKARPDLLPANAALPSDGQSNADDKLISNESYPGKSLRLGEESPAQEKNTTTEIISLLEQMQRPTYLNYNDRPQGFCLKYMGQYTAI